MRFQCLLFFLLCTGWSSGQDLQKDLTAIVSSLDSASSVSIRTSVSVYDHKGGKKLYGAQASLQRNKTAVLSILDDIENYENQDYSVSVDHDDKVMMVAKKDKPKIKAEDLSKADLKKIQKLLSEERGNAPKPQIKMVSDKEGIRTYAVSGLSGISAMEMTLDMKVLAIQEITYTYSSASGGQYIEIQYKEFKKGADLSSTLRQGRYFTLKNGKYVLSQPYTSYELQTP